MLPWPAEFRGRARVKRKRETRLLGLCVACLSGFVNPAHQKHQPEKLALFSVRAFAYASEYALVSHSTDHGNFLLPHSRCNLLHRFPVKRKDRPKMDGPGAGLSGVEGESIYEGD